jgi:Head domain of trimeric autotransporter adhesin
MKKITGLLICILLLQHFSATAQSFAINTTGAAAHASAILDVTSINKGLLIPRLTTAQRTAIASPAKGLMVYDSTLKSFYFHDGLAWQQISADSNNLWRKNGNDIYNSNTGNVGIGISTPLSFLHVKGSFFIIDSTIRTMPVNGAGTRMMWIPSKGAFRAGRVDNTQWDSANIGYYSFAVGYGNTASNHYDVAMGQNNTAGPGRWAFAMGSNSIASGDNSTAMGEFSFASGIGATALSGGEASGRYSTGLSPGGYSSGYASVSIGFISNAIGDNSTSMGYWLDSKSFAGTVIGTLNDTTSAPSATVINPLNRLFQIGNGTASNARSNAMTVLQNGNVGIGTTTPDALLHVQKGAVLFDSTIGSTPVSGAGTRMMWIPAKIAFRAGAVSGTQWDDANIGTYSFAAGWNTKASGIFSTSMGDQTTASSGSSTAMGYLTSAIGAFSTSMGYFTTASGEATTAMGYATKSKSMGGFVTGLFNDSTNAGSPNMINSLNRIFQIGNGTADYARSNAMTVLQNGNIGIGEVNPAYPLNFTSTLGDKISLWGNGANHYGFGIQPSLLQVYTDVAGSDIAFGYGNSAAFTERMRVKGNGNVGIGVNPVAKLQVAGNETSAHGLAAAIQLNNTASANVWNIRAGATGTATPADGFSIGDNAAYRFVITSAGNVGIGNTAPAATLDVTGTTTTDGLQVSNGTVITKMQSGSVTVGSSGSSQLITTIVFPVAFASALPRVFATARNEPASSFTDAFSVSVRSVSANSVTLNIQRTDANTGWGQQLRIDWFAVE